MTRKAHISKVCAQISPRVKIVLQQCLILVTDGTKIVLSLPLALSSIPDIFFVLIGNILVYSLDVAIFTVIYTEVVR